MFEADSFVTKLVHRLEGIIDPVLHRTYVAFLYRPSPCAAF